MKAIKCSMHSQRPKEHDGGTIVRCQGSRLNVSKVVMAGNRVVFDDGRKLCGEQDEWRKKMVQHKRNVVQFNNVENDQ